MPWISRKRLDELERLERIDPLTRVGNGRRLHEVLDDAVRDPRGGAILLVDVDSLILLNDQCGHEAADAVLVALARVCAARISQKGVVVRMGGDEFLMALPWEGLQAGRAVAESVRLAAHALGPVSASGEAVAMSVTIGVARLRTPLDGSLEAVYRAMLRGKQAGGDCVVVEDDEDAGPFG